MRPIRTTPARRTPVRRDRAHNRTRDHGRAGRVSLDVAGVPGPESNYRRVLQRSWLNWIEHLTTDQKVGGSSPSERAAHTHRRGFLVRAFETSRCNRKNRRIRCGRRRRTPDEQGPPESRSNGSWHRQPNSFRGSQSTPALTPSVLDRLVFERGFPLTAPGVTTFAYRGDVDSVRLIHFGIGLPEDLSFERLGSVQLVVVGTRFTRRHPPGVPTRDRRR